MVAAEPLQHPGLAAEPAAARPQARRGPGPVPGPARLRRRRGGRGQGVGGGRRAVRGGVGGPAGGQGGAATPDRAASGATVHPRDRPRLGSDLLHRPGVRDGRPGTRPVRPTGHERAGGPAARGRATARRSWRALGEQRSSDALADGDHAGGSHLRFARARGARAGGPGRTRARRRLARGAGPPRAGAAAVVAGRRRP